MEDHDPSPAAPRRSLRRVALTELNETVPEEPNTPKNSSPDEMVILQRGPRRKPVTWSPVDYDRDRVLGPPREVTPEPEKHTRRSELSSALRRRLALSPSKETSYALGQVIAKKLKMLPKCKSDS